MFKFVHAWQPGDTWEPLAADGFAGIEVGGPAIPELPAGAAVIGRRHATSGDDLAEGGAYVIVPPEHGPAAEAGVRLRGAACRTDPARLLVPNDGAFTTPLALWTLLEAARHPSVRIALDAAVAHSNGQRAAVLVPTLNLRIGVVRVEAIDDELADYARRLAGIGFDGYVVTDPPAGVDRAAASVAIAAAFRAVLPPIKPVKKVPAKVAR